MCEDKFRKYMHTKFEWNNEIFDKVRWKALGHVMESFKHGTRISLVKLMFGWQYNNRWKMKRKKKTKIDVKDQSGAKLAEARKVTV